MRQTKTDRRSLRTRQLLMRALIELIRLKRYESITVQEITDRADVGRSTFYAHFTDKDDLLADGVQQMMDGIDTFATGPAPATGKRAGWPYPSLGLLRHIGEQADLYQALSRGRGLSLFLSALHEELTVRATERLTARVPPGVTPRVPVPLLAAMTSSMLITASRAWVAGGLAQSAESVDAAFHTAADAAIRAGLRPVDNPPDGAALSVVAPSVGTGG